MKKLIITILAVAALAVPDISTAMPARPGPYLSGFIGASMPLDTDASGAFNDEIRFDPGFNAGGTIGMDFGAVRFEGEISYKEGEVDTIYNKDTNTTFTGIEGSVEATAFMANVFIDLHSPGPITPYVGGGVGFAALHLTDTYDRQGTLFYISDDEVAFAYQVGAGLEVALNRQVSLDLGYRFFGTSEASFADTDLEFRSHNATVGFRLKF